MSSTETSTSRPFTTTSPTLLAIDDALRPKDEVACMSCPLAVWMLESKTVKCYCRMLYTFVWETTVPGKITICDGPALAAAAAQTTD